MCAEFIRTAHVRLKKEGVLNHETLKQHNCIHFIGYNCCSIMMVIIIIIIIVITIVKKK